ncbi:conserved hypothetical protein [Candidatus Sulfopaludibacter sp. SbA4]|nr:conserved hypothetical protein [Candidatus Sulfopaludibacter sp. SbA4]
MPRDEAHLLDILKAARLAVEFKGTADKDAFLTDAKTQSAVLHQLLVIGEAVKRLSPEFRAAHPEVPWKLIAGTRDKLIHFYEGVDLEEVWKMLTSDLPEPIQLIEPLAPDAR